MRAPEELAALTKLPFRNAYEDFEHVPSRTVAEGEDRAEPLVTIAIPTFRRPDLLVETVASAMAQRFDCPFEIVVVDNDPQSRGAEQLMAQLPALAQRNFRYFVNVENIGQFPNHNRCIEVARAPWVTIINDDDLLDEACLATLFAEIDADPAIDGLAARKRFLDQRANLGTAKLKAEVPELISQRMSPRLMLKYAAGDSLARRELIRRAGGRMFMEYMFRGKTTRRIDARLFFWGNVLGNGAAFIFRREKALEMGGFYPEEHPSADFWFYARFAALYHLRQHRAELASVRMNDGNESVRTVNGQLQSGHRLQRSLVGAAVPRWWGRILPLVMAHHRADFRDFWGVEVQQAELEEALGFRLPRNRPRRLSALRFLLNGY